MLLGRRSQKELEKNQGKNSQYVFLEGSPTGAEMTRTPDSALRMPDLLGLGCGREPGVHKFPRKQERGAGFGEISQNKDGTLLVKV